MKATLHVPLLADTQMAREIELERMAAEEGAARYERMSQFAVERGEGAQLQPAERMCAAWFDSLKDEISRLKASVMLGRAGGGRQVYGPVLAAADTRATTAIVLHEAMSAAMQSPKGWPLTKVAYAIGSSVVADIHIRVAQERKADTKELDRYIERYARRIPQMVNRWAKRTLDDHVWSIRVCSTLGLALAWKLVGACLIIDDDDKPHAAFSVDKVIRDNRTTNYLSLRPWTQSLLAEAQMVRRGMRPRFGPMVVPPLHWGRRTDGTLEEGGHYRLRTPFVVKPTRSLRTRLESAAIDSVFTALNHISGVAWQVDPFIKDTVSTLLEQGGGVAGLPKSDPIPLPPRPESGEELKLWKRQAANIHEANKRAFSSRNDLLLALSTADRLESEQAIWFPHQLDFRGRVYPVPLHLSHIGEDPRRAMLRFAQAVPVRDDRWLKIHAANCWGHDKVPFEQRIAWVESQARDIERFASDPFLHDGWMAAENPFQFLASCRALVDGKAAARLPVHQDGSCNGYQHLAALGRDVVGGSAVNLVPGDKPSDIYAAVAAVAKAKVEALAAEGDPIAKALAPIIDRKVVKQPVMTVPYGVTRAGVRDQLEPRLVEKGIEKGKAGMHAHWLSKVVLDSIGDQSRGARDIMVWLKEAVRTILKAHPYTPIEWTSPMGFPVMQPYWNTRNLQITSEIGKWKIHLGVPMEDDRQQVAWNVNGISPNFIHSLDACHMMMTATSMIGDGLDFAAVHDSYWSHVENAPFLSERLRETFVSLHGVDQIARLRSEWMSRYGVDLPEGPKHGTLDLDDVKRSAYFFA
jgi:DNA-directed RNA polymerase